jgi:outer membrane protein TolC
MPPIFRRPTSTLTLLAIFVCLPSRTHGRQTTAPAGVQKITLPEAQARAAASAKVRAAELSADADRYHRQAATADYFPKVGSTFLNLHFNKLMGEHIALSRQSLDVRLLNKDQSLVALTVTQPVTPLLKVRQAVNVARADERIAQAKLSDTTLDVTHNVEHSYFDLLVADFRQKAAASRLDDLRSRTLIASAAPSDVAASSLRSSQLLTAEEDVAISRSKVEQLMRSLNALLGLPLDTELALVAPDPLPDETISLTTARQRASAANSEVIEAEQTVVKAQAAVNLSKLEYVPDVAVMAGYAYQTALDVLPADFSFLGIVATFNVFDFGKREKTLKERKTYLELAQLNLQAARSKVSAAVQSAYNDLEKATRNRNLRGGRLSEARTQSHPVVLQDEKAREFDAEAELAQAEWDYRIARLQLHKLLGTP